jgi:sulfate adenylyltransferase subunit 1 (EFTu-like GTPase family)
LTLDLLRFTTAGSVDDGKSTLIGRLLYDTKQVFEDQLEHVAQASERRGGRGALDLALLTDGLRAEREQGITIDVAYRYFATPGIPGVSEGRRFIIADCPGHRQYTRNMVTGASTADLSVILLDARKGVLEQSKRHAFISALLGIPHLVVAVNKMDLVDYSRGRFEELVAEFESFAHRLGGGVSSAATSVDVDVAGDGDGDGAGPRRDILYVPMSALEGDNVVERSDQMGWYDGPTLLEHLESVEVAYDHPYEKPARLPVQWVIRPSGQNPESDLGLTSGLDAAAADDYRGYAGQIASGALSRGDEIEILPSGKRTRIAAIDTYDGELQEAVAPMSVTVRLEDELDVSRGELICKPEEAPGVARELEADVCWMSDRPLRAGGRYAIKHTTRNASAIVDELIDLVDVHTLERSAGPPLELALNDIGRINLRTSSPIAFDPYAENRRTGSFILIDEASNETVAAGMIAG